MDKLRLYFLKALKKLSIIKYFNFQLTKTINGIKLKIPFINGMGLNNYVSESDWLDSLIEQFISQESDAFVDVGTNIGQTLLKIKSLSPGIKYLGFEPNSSCVQYLWDLIHRNHFNDCTIFNCALFSSVKFLNLEKSLTDDLRASVITLLRPGYFKGQETVMAIDYDSFLNNQKISFVKIDAEGSELEVIEGMKQSIQKYQPIIVCEVLDSHNSSTLKYTQSRTTELCRLIHSLNYSIFHIKKEPSKNQIIDFIKINEICIRQYTFESSLMNDYIFCPKKKIQSL
jgi:FkbM family methyltransferase